MNKVNRNKKYYYQVIGLLADMDFVRKGLIPSRSLTLDGFSVSNIYRVETEGDLKKITAYFKKRTEQATDFTLIMFKEIYKTKKDNLRIEVG